MSLYSTLEIVLPIRLRITARYRVDQPESKAIWVRVCLSSSPIWHCYDLWLIWFATLLAAFSVYSMSSFSMPLSDHSHASGFLGVCFDSELTRLGHPFSRRYSQSGDVVESYVRLNV